MASEHLKLSKRPGAGAVDVEVLKRKSWPEISAQFVHLAAPTTFDFRITSSSDYILLLDLYRVDGETSASGHSTSCKKDLRNKLTYLPKGCDLEGWCKIEKSGSITAVAIDPSVSASQSIDLAVRQPLVEFDDPMLCSVLMRFRAILDDPSLDSLGYAETLAKLLAFDLSRVSARQPRQQSNRGGLTASQVQLITEYMDSHLTDKTTISELAARLDLTRFHFIRAFKQTAGIPPHQFMIQRRVDRAKELLADRHVNVAEVATKTGFGSALQLTRAFRRVVGTTPSSYRRNH